jgi:hypothetical protein
MGWECVGAELFNNKLTKVIFISNYFCEELIYLITNLRLFSQKQKGGGYLLTIYLLLFISKWV